MNSFCISICHRKGIDKVLEKFYAGFLSKKTKPPSLVSLCVGVIGRHLEDIIVDLSEIADNLPADIKVGYWKMILFFKSLNRSFLS